jgi:hypothetical protein
MRPHRPQLWTRLSSALVTVLSLAIAGGAWWKY